MPKSRTIPTKKSPFGLRNRSKSGPAVYLGRNSKGIVVGNRKQLESFVRNADPESMLELGLRFRQALNLK